LARNVSHDPGLAPPRAGRFFGGRLLEIDWEVIGRPTVKVRPALAGLGLAGHEPTWSETLGLLVGGGRHRVPTGALAGIDLEAEAWADVRPGAGYLAFLLPPRLLADQ
jgi:hypothetical protein